MSEAERRCREFERQERGVPPGIGSKTRKWLTLGCLADELIDMIRVRNDVSFEIVVNNDPLVMPFHLSLRCPEQILAAEIRRTFQHINNAVVKSQERDVKLRKDDVRVISRITDNGDALRVARKILLLAARSCAEDELVILTIVVEIGRVLRTAAVQAVQVKARRSEVLQHVGVVASLKTRDGIKRKVMRNELSEIRVSRRYCAVELGV